MRSLFIAGLAALLVSGSAMGATQVVLEARGLGSVITAEEANAGFILDVLIELDPADASGMSAFEVGFNASAGDPQYAPFTVLYGAIVENYVDSGFTNSSGWSVAPALTQVLPGGALNSLVGTPNAAASVNDTAFATGGFAVYLEIEAGAGFPTDSESEIIPVAIILGDQGFDQIPSENVGYTPLTITPEPASALLLLLGIPFLRRRR